MLQTVTIEEIDQLLDELEQLAHSSTSRRRFFASVLERLKFLVGASATGIMMRATSQQWIPMATLGIQASEQLQQFLSKATESQEFLQSSDRRWLAVPIRRSPTGETQWQRGALLVEFDSQPPESDCASLVKLCNAFAEVLAIRQWTELETLLDQKWLGFQKSLAGMAFTSSTEECAYAVVNDLAALLQADRVSLVQATGWAHPKALAISGVIKAEQKAARVASIEQLCLQAIKKQQPLSNHTTDSEDAQADASPVGFENYVCIPVASRTAAKVADSDTAVLFEWQDYDSFLLGCTTLNYVFPAFVASWQQQQRWVRVPKLVRRLFGRPAAGTLGRLSRSTIRWAIVAALAIAIVWALMRPSVLRIEAEGTLQPVDQRAVFAALDGVVERVHVIDGQAVERGQPLVQMRSPMLEIEIQGVLGDLDANAKKRDGLNVAINQLTNDEPTSYAMQSRFSSEIRELETQLQTLQSKHAALVGEREKLQITSPIDGVIVARQIKRYLDSRPVKRGDALLRVVRLDGPWKLELQIADQDAGYVKRAMFGEQKTPGTVSPRAGTIPANAGHNLQFVFASQPDVPREAVPVWLSESARNPNGEGMVVDVMADVDAEIAASGHMGATVYAYFDCGKQPFWFVWSRPFVEAVQRKIWF